MHDLIWTEDALRDLDDIGVFIANDNPRSAANMIRRIVASVASLTNYPQMGRTGRDRTTRELVVPGTPYIAAYRVRQRVEIIAIFHSSRNWPERFEG
jgi:toxin ParE1/3/4